MENLFGENETPALKPKHKGSLKFNPCIDVYGKGPEGTKCKTCEHLFCKQFAKKYYKCDLRKITGGVGSDHKINFPSCGKYKEAE